MPVVLPSFSLAIIGRSGSGKSSMLKELADPKFAGSRPKYVYNSTEYEGFSEITELSTLATLKNALVVLDDVIFPRVAEQREFRHALFKHRRHQGQLVFFAFHQALGQNLYGLLPCFDKCISTRDLLKKDFLAILTQFGVHEEVDSLWKGYQSCCNNNEFAYFFLDRRTGKTTTTANLETLKTAVYAKLSSASAESGKSNRSSKVNTSAAMDDARLLVVKDKVSRIFASLQSDKTGQILQLFEHLFQDEHSRPRHEASYIDGDLGVSLRSSQESELKVNLIDLLEAAVSTAAPSRDVKVLWTLLTSNLSVPKALVSNTTLRNIAGGVSK